LTLFGSYRKKFEDIKASSFNIPYAVVFCGLLAALTIFVYMGNMSVVGGIAINEIPLGGPGSLFIYRYMINLINVGRIDVCGISDGFVLDAVWEFVGSGFLLYDACAGDRYTGDLFNVY